MLLNSTEFGMQFNSAKTKCMYFKCPRSPQVILPGIHMSGRKLEWVKVFKYLGTWLTSSLDDQMDIEQKRQESVRQMNSVLHQFYIVPAFLKDDLIQTYCSSLHGCQSWDLSTCDISRLQTAWNKTQRLIWNLPNVAHCAVVNGHRAMIHFYPRF